MAQDIFAPPCGCIWHGGRHDQGCEAWLTLVAARDELRQGEDIDYRKVRRIEEQMAGHMPPWMDGEAP